MLNYSPLNAERQEIRLLTLQPAGAWDNPIRCDITTVSLIDEPQYDALSYVWGDWDNSLKIKVGGQDVEVTRNLYKALRRVRNHHSEPVQLWVDAICINQNDEQERGSQVSLMGKLYSSCQQTIMWMGEWDDSVNQLEQRPVKMTGDAADFESKHWKEYMTSFGLTGDDLQLLLAGKMKTPAWDAIDWFLHVAWFFRLLAEGHHITTLPPFSSDLVTTDYCTAFYNSVRWLRINSYFGRLWVVQEFVLTPVATVMICSIQMPMDLLTKATDEFTRHLQEKCCPGYAERDYALRSMLRIVANFFEAISYERESFRDKIPRNLMSLCHAFAAKSCRDDIDKVYALLSLVTNSYDSRPLFPDYTCSAASVFTTVSKDFYLQSSSRILFCTDPQVPKVQGLPSWVVDFSAISAPVQSFWSTQVLQYRAGMGWKTNITINDDNALFVGGKQIDVIEHVGDLMNVQNDAERVATFRNWHELTGMLGSPDRPYPSGGTWREAFWRTLSGDTAQDSVGRYKRVWSDNLVVVYASIARLRGYRTLGASFEPISDDAFTFKEGDTGFVDEANVLRYYEETTNIIKSTLHHRRMFVTAKGHVGFGRSDLVAGDAICIIADCNAPCILRRTGTFHKWQNKEYAGNTSLNGCYVHGVMDGEAVSGEDTDGSQYLCIT